MGVKINAVAMLMTVSMRARDRGEVSGVIVAMAAVASRRAKRPALIIRRESERSESQPAKGVNRVPKRPLGTRMSAVWNMEYPSKPCR